MKNINQEPHRKKYNFNDHSWYYGAYLNMARHNLFLLVNHISEKFSYLKFDLLSDDEAISNNKHILANIFDVEQREFENDRFKVYKYLVKRHYLPCIKIFHGEQGCNLDANPIVDYTGLHKFLLSVFQQVNIFRNSFSHYLSIDSDGCSVSEKEVGVDVGLKQTLKQLHEQGKAYSLKRYSLTQNEADYEHIEKYYSFEVGSNKLTNNGLLFFTCLFLERSYAYRFLKRIEGFKNETESSFRATLQVFTAYSLTLTDSRLDSEYTQTALLMDMLNELQRCPQELYKNLSDEDKQKFEPSLDADAQQNILTNSVNDLGIEDDDTDAYLANLTSLKRNRDRFPYFALRYLEELNLLPNIRFQIAVGKLQTKAYPKTITQVEVNRRIINDINLFGKLGDFEGKEDATLLGLKPFLKEEDNEFASFDQYAPHYNMEGNRIAFKIITNDAIDYTDRQPTGFISLNDLPKLVLLAYYNPSEAEKVIQGFIENNEHVILNKKKLDSIKAELSLLPEKFTRRLVDEKAISGRNGKTEYLTKEIEQSLLNMYGLNDQFLTIDSKELKRKVRNPKDWEHLSQIRYKAFLQQRKEELQKHLPDGVLVNQLPTQVINELLNISNIDSSKSIHKKIKEIKQDCKNRVNRLAKKEGLPLDEQHLKLGELATFLARDIIDMIIDEETKQKITSVYYDRLQNRIAYFSQNKKEIIELCKELNIFDKNRGHVFLIAHHINNASGVTDFYTSYLTQKQEWIENNLFIRGKKGGYYLPDNTRIPYSYRKLNKGLDKNIDTWLGNKLKTPVNLPNNLLNEALEKQLSIKLHKGKIAFNEGDRYSIRLSKLMNEDCQPFYRLIRKYKEGDLDCRQKVDASKELEKRYGKYVVANEKRIRSVQTQDRVMKLMCQRILEKQASDTIYFDLANIMPFSEQSILNMPYQFNQKIVRKGNDNYFVVTAKDNDQQIEQVQQYEALNDEAERESYGKQKGYQWTVKDYGRFKRFVADKRIPQLSQYFEDKTVSIDMISYQLREYDKHRELIFEKTFFLEEAICKIDSERVKQLELEARKDGKKDFNNVQFDIYCTWINEKGLLNESESTILREIRNRFSHSQFPNYFDHIPKISKEQVELFEKVKLTKGEVKNMDISLAEKIYERYESLITKVLKC